MTGCPKCRSSVEAAGELCEHQRRTLDARLPTLPSPQMKLIRETLLRCADGRLVNQVLVDVTSQVDVGTDEAVAVMWDLVDLGLLTYGTNGRVNRV